MAVSSGAEAYSLEGDTGSGGSNVGSNSESQVAKEGKCKITQVGRSRSEIGKRFFEEVRDL